MVGGSRGMLSQENIDFSQNQKHYFRDSGRIFALLYML